MNQKKLDQEFDTNLNEILNLRFSIFFFDIYKGFLYGEITDKVIQIVRKLKQKYRLDLVQKTSQQFYYQESSNTRFLRNPKFNQQQYLLFQNKSKSNYKDQFAYHDQKQFEQQSIQRPQNFANYEYQQELYNDNIHFQTLSDQKESYYSYQKKMQFLLMKLCNKTIIFL
ncbi:unnamed protein product [Paramecium sonneborni]|uniref:Uncharacterized protein n=1 Tax=Paramecium sonneborni TaxID=65129 RepID=A0A8S1R6F4_9CILI|nr:unnamed protein product [Paramecium sonneborni]